MINAELRMDHDHIDSITIDGNMRRGLTGRTTTTLTLEITVGGEVDMAALTAVIHGETYGGHAVGEDAVTLRRIADVIGGEACNDEQEPEPRVRRRRTGVRDLDVG